VGSSPLTRVELRTCTFLNLSPLFIYFICVAFGVRHGKPGKVLEFLNGYCLEIFGKVHLRSLIERINIYINIYYFNQTIVSHSFVSFKVY